MRAKLKRPAAALTVALGLAIAAAVPGSANARGAKHAHPVAPPPPPGIGYYGEFPVQLDYAQAQAWSLARPYYTHFLYDYCDYRNCVLRRNSKGEWAPVWYGPVN